MPSRNISSYWLSFLIVFGVLVVNTAIATDIIEAGESGLAPSPKGEESTAIAPEEENLTTILEAVNKYKEQGHLDDAKKLLEANLDENPPIGKKDVEKRIKLMAKLEEVKAAIVAKDQQRLRGLVKQLNETPDEAEKEALRNLLRTELQAGSMKQATGFTAEIERAITASDTSSQRPMLEFLRSALVALREPATKTGQILIQIIIYFVFVVLGLWIFRFIRDNFLSMQGVGLVLEDETKPVEEREEANRKLGMLMAHEIRSIESGGTPGIEAAGLSDQAGTESSIGKAAEFKDFVDDTPIKVGPITLNPKQIFTFLVRLLSPPHKYLLSGSLTQAHDVTSLSVTERSPSGKIYKDHRYYASAPGCADKQREQVVRDVAIQFAARRSVSVTRDWKSLRAYREADEILERKCVGEDRNKNLEEALSTLQRSLRHDPSNWMARHNAGIVLRRLGRHRDAADQFDYLERMLSSPGIRDHSYYKTFLANQPDFEWMVSYNLALSLAATENWNDTRNAIDRIGKLLKKAGSTEDTSGGRESSKRNAVNTINKTGDEASSIENASRSQKSSNKPSQQIPNKDHLIALARSARAVAFTMKLELLRRQIRRGEKLHQDVEEKMRNYCNKVDSDERWIWNTIKEGKVQQAGDWQAYARAHSAAQSACGRAHYLIGEYKRALTYLRWAVSIHAPEAFAEPFIHMAAVIIKLKNEYGVDWISQAEKYLNKALEINPTHSKAHHLRGQIFADPSEGRYEDAKKEFKAAGDHWASLAEHARILWEQDQDHEGALKLLRRSLSIENLADDRAVLFCEVVSKVTDADEKLLEEGIEWAELLKSKGLTAQLRKRGSELRRILNDRRKKLQKTGNKSISGPSVGPEEAATK